MKKIIILMAVAVLAPMGLYAQKEKSVKETDVPARYVKDFHNQVKEAQDVVWTMTADSVYFTATFINSDADRQALRFGPKGTETRYYVDAKYYPHAIKDSVAHQYPRHKIDCIYICNTKGKSTYMARIYRKKGFLFFKKECDVKMASFETNGKLIEVLDEE